MIVAYRGMYYANSYAILSIQGEDRFTESLEFFLESPDESKFNTIPSVYLVPIGASSFTVKIAAKYTTPPGLYQLKFTHYNS